MKGGHHLIFTQYFIILTLTRGEGGIFGKSRGVMVPTRPPPLPLSMAFGLHVLYVFNMRVKFGVN